MKKYLLFGMLISILAFSANAQVTTSNIQGTVIDDEAAPLMGANVVAIHIPTGT